MSQEDASTPDRRGGERPRTGGVPFARSADASLPSLRTSVEFARVDVRRGVRWAGEQDFWLLYGLVSGVGLLIGTWFAFDAARAIGRTLAAGEPTRVSATGVRVALGAAWSFLTVALVVDAVGSNGDVEHDGHSLSIRPVPDVAGGKLLAAAGKFAGFVVGPALAGAAGLALGTGSPLAAVGVVAAAAVLIGSATAVGYPVGLTMKGVIRRSETLTRLKPILAVAFGGAYVVVVGSGGFTALVDELVPVLNGPPLGWLGDLALATTPGGDAGIAAPVGALALGAASVAVGGPATVRAARYAWAVDRARPSGSGTAEDATAPSNRFEALIDPFSPSPAMTGVASTALLRAYRSPLRLVFVAFPLVGAIPLGEQILAAGSVPRYLPWLVVWYGAWAAGAALPLNPLGSQGATLPRTLTAPATGRDVVLGYVLAAVIPVAPATAGLAVGAGHLAGVPPGELVVLAVAAVGAVLASALLAAGIGALFPRFEAVDFGGSRRAVPPSKVAYGAFATALSLSVLAIAAVTDALVRRAVALVLSRRLPFGLAVDAAVVESAGWVVLAAAVVSVPLAYRVAVDRIDRYRLS